MTIYTATINNVSSSQIDFCFKMYEYSRFAQIIFTISVLVYLVYNVMSSKCVLL